MQKNAQNLENQNIEGIRYTKSTALSKPAQKSKGSLELRCPQDPISEDNMYLRQISNLYIYQEF